MHFEVQCTLNFDYAKKERKHVTGDKKLFTTENKFTQARIETVDK